MKKTVNIIPNICDVDFPSGEYYGEQCVVIYNGKVIFRHDHSDEYLDIEDSRSALKEIAKEVKCKPDDLVFKTLDNPTPEVLSIVETFLASN
jgi:hypothetical protein